MNKRRHDGCITLALRIRSALMAGVDKPAVTQGQSRWQAPARSVTMETFTLA
jgi:hypothetical protein